MFSWEWENLEAIFANGVTIDDHGPLKGPIYKFSINRGTDLHLCMVTQANESAQDTAVVEPPGTVRINDDKVTFASSSGHELTAEGVQAKHTQIRIEGGAPGVLTQKVRIHRLSGKIFPYERTVKYAIDWLENVDPVFVWPNRIDEKAESNTSRIFGGVAAPLVPVSSETLTMSGSGNSEGGSWACVRLTVDGTTLFLCEARAGIAQHIQKPGYIVYEGDPTEEFRDKVRRCLSFCLGMYLVYLGSSWLDDTSHLIWFEAVSAYSLRGRAMELPPTPPSPLGTRWQWEINREILTRMVNAIYRKYEDLNFGVVSWAYWHAVAASPHIAAVHYGAALESLLRAYSKVESLSRTQQILDLGQWQTLRKNLELCLDQVDITPEIRRIFKNKIQNLNSRSQHSSGKDLVDKLALRLSARERAAYDSRHESAHGKDDEVDVEWIRDLKIMRIRFHRILLSMTQAHDSYYDYFTLGHPVRNLQDPIAE
jgi:hypothetical protein